MSDGVGNKKELDFRTRFSGFVAILAFGAVLVSHARFVETTKPPEPFVEEIRKVTDHPTVAMLGADIASGHPLTRMVGGRWVEPYCSDWILNYARRMVIHAQQHNNSQSEQRYLRMLADYVARKRKRFLESPPDVILVDRANEVSSLLMGAFFDLIAERYRKIGDSGLIAAYERK